MAEKQRSQTGLPSPWSGKGNTGAKRMLAAERTKGGIKGPTPEGAAHNPTGEATGSPAKNKPRFFVAGFFNSLLR